MECLDASLSHPSQIMITPDGSSCQMKNHIITHKGPFPQTKNSLWNGIEHGCVNGSECIVSKEMIFTRE